MVYPERASLTGAAGEIGRPFADNRRSLIKCPDRGCRWACRLSGRRNRASLTGDAEIDVVLALAGQAGMPSVVSGGALRLSDSGP